MIDVGINSVDDSSDKRGEKMLFLSFYSCPYIYCILPLRTLDLNVFSIIQTNIYHLLTHCLAIMFMCITRLQASRRRRLCWMQTSRLSDHTGKINFNFKLSSFSFFFITTLECVSRLYRVT